MIDDSSNILDIFHQYAYPTILISPDKVVTVKNWIEGFVVFTAVMMELKLRRYDHSETAATLKG